MDLFIRVTFKSSLESASSVITVFKQNMNAWLGTEVSIRYVLKGYFLVGRRFDTLQSIPKIFQTSV